MAQFAERGVVLLHQHIVHSQVLTGTRHATLLRILGNLSNKC